MRLVVLIGRHCAPRSVDDSRSTSGAFVDCSGFRCTAQCLSSLQLGSDRRSGCRARSSVRRRTILPLRCRSRSRFVPWNVADQDPPGPPRTPVRCSWWIQLVVATPACWSDRRCSSRASAGVRQERVLRGRWLRALATAWISSALHRERSVPLGKYWRSSPLDAPMFVKLRPVRCSHGRRTP